MVGWPMCNDEYTNLDRATMSIAQQNVMAKETEPNIKERATLGGSSDRRYA